MSCDYCGWEKGEIKIFEGRSFCKLCRNTYMANIHTFTNDVSSGEHKIGASVAFLFNILFDKLEINIDDYREIKEEDK